MVESGGEGLSTVFGVPREDFETNSTTCCEPKKLVTSPRVRSRDSAVTGVCAEAVEAPGRLVRRTLRCTA